MNAKVHHCWVTPSQPSEAWGMMMEVEDDDDGGWDDDGGGWDDDDGGWRWGRKKRSSTRHVSVEFEILCPQLRVPCLLLFPILIIAFSSLPPSFLRVDLVSPITLNLAFFVSFWLGVGNACPLVCTPPVTLEVGLRTIPSVVSSFRYLSTNSIVPGPGSI